MAHTLLLLLALLLPSSSPAASAPTEAVKNALSAYAELWFLAEGRLEDFDRELARDARPGLLARSRSYRDLLALRSLLEHRQHEIGELFEKLGTAAEREDLAAHLRALGQAERLALADVAKDLASRSSSLPLLYPSLAEELSAKRASSSLLTRRVARARANPTLAREVRRAGALVRFPGAGAPRAAKIVPDPGPAGNVYGSEFPPNTWAVTYDDGPHPQRTQEILAKLAAHGKKASFFWLSENLEKHPAPAAAAIAAGMSVNNHSWSHLKLSEASQQQLVREISHSTEQQAKAYGQRPRFFRLPYGAGLRHQPARKLIAENGMVHVFWTVDSLDWKDKSPQSILDRVKKGMAAEKRGVILLHDIHPQTVAASELLLQFSATLDGTPQAHRWVTLPEIVDELNAR